MAADPKTLEALKTFVSAVETKSSMEKFVALFKDGLMTLTAFKEHIQNQVEALQQSVQTALRTQDARIAALKDGADGKEGAVGPMGPAGPQGAPGESVVGPAGMKGADGSPDTPAEIRNKLETLEGTDRLKASAIEGLEDLEPRLSELDRKASRVQTPAKSYQIHTKDVSAQCDGNNRSFSVGGSHFGIIGVFSTQDPKVFLPVIDYTQTQTGITMSSAIPAIASGQSLIIQYLQ